jgi:toxin ParE1/3/4
VTHKVIWREAASADLDALYDWIANLGEPEIALRFTLRIEAACERLTDFPHRGTPREDINPGLRSIPFERTVTIFYLVEKTEVQIVHVLHGARDIVGAF